MINRCKRLFILLICILLLSSCGRPGTGPDASEPDSADISQSETPVYALITKEKTNSYMQKMEEGFIQACEEVGAEAVCCGPSDYSAEAQIKFIEDLIEQGVDAIAVAANDADALANSLQSAMDNGIIVLSLDSAVDPDNRMLHIQQADPEKIGRVLAQAAADMIGYSGTIGIITTTGYATNQNVWIEWLKREIEDYPDLYRDIVLLPEVYGEDDEEKTVEQTLYLLGEYPELDIIITPSVVSMVAVGETLREQGSDVLFTGLGLPSEMADFIEIDKSCKWFYLWNPIDVGYLTAYTADALYNGDITGEVGEIFEAGTLGERVLTQSGDGGNEVLLGAPIKFDEENISLWKTVY